MRSRQQPYRFCRGRSIGFLECELGPNLCHIEQRGTIILALGLNSPAAAFAGEGPTLFYRQHESHHQLEPKLA
jgi:hypothetical protein